MFPRIGQGCMHADHTSSLRKSRLKMHMKIRQDYVKV